MINIVAAVFLISTGIASQYAPGVMDNVIETRQSWGDLDFYLSRYDGFVAVPYAHDLESTWYVRPIGTVKWYKVLATDCGGIADNGRDWMLDNGIVFEINYELAEEWDTVGRGIFVEYMSESEYNLYVQWLENLRGSIV